MSTVIKHKLQRKCRRPAAAPRRAGRRHRPVRALPLAGAAPRAPPGGPAPEATRARRARAPLRTARPPERGAGASKTQICRAARRPRAARAASRARCAGRAPDLFFGRPNAPGHDLPSPPAARDERRRQGPDAAARPVPHRARAGTGGWASPAPRAAIAQPAHPARARAAHAAPLNQVLVARTRPCQTSCAPAAALRPGTADGSAARRSRRPAARACAALRVSCISRARQVGALALRPAHTQHAHALSPLLHKPGRFCATACSACCLRNATPGERGAVALRNWSVFILPFSVWCRHRSRLAFRHAPRVRASHQAPAPVPALTSPLRCSPPASRSFPSSREPWSPCAGHVASIPAEQLDCRGCSAARFAPPRNVQVPLPEGIPRGVEDLPAARARRRQCRQPLDHAVRPAALGRPFHVHRLFPAARRAGTRRTCSSSTRAT